MSEMKLEWDEFGKGGVGWSEIEWGWSRVEWSPHEVEGSGVE